MIEVRNIAQNSSDNLPSYSSDSIGWDHSWEGTLVTTEQHVMPVRNSVGCCVSETASNINSGTSK